MTSQEMFKCKAGEGFVFVNIARVDEPQNWVIQPAPEHCDANALPKLFGYEQAEFLAKQYR